MALDILTDEDLYRLTEDDRKAYLEWNSPTAAITINEQREKEKTMLNTNKENQVPTIQRQQGVCYIHSETQTRLNVSKYGHFLIPGGSTERIPIFDEDDIAYYLHVHAVNWEGWGMYQAWCHNCCSPIDPNDTICFLCKVKIFTGLDALLKKFSKDE